MSREDLIKRVKEIFAQEVNITLEETNLDTKLESINIDSLDIIKVALALEKNFNVTITTAELMQIDTFGDIIDGIERRLASQ